MGKRRTRITPKRRKRPSKSPKNLNKSQEEKSSNEDNMKTKTTRRVGSRTTSASKRKAASSESETNFSQCSSNASLGSESHEESVQIPKKKRHIGEKRAKSTKRNEKSVATRKEDATTNRVNHGELVKRHSKKMTRSSRKDSRTSERIRDLIVSKNVFSKWKPLSISTKDYIKQVIVNTSPHILDNVSSHKRKYEVQHYLSDLEKRILVRMNKIRGPSQQLDYRHIEQETKRAEESLTSVSYQLSLLKDELQEQQRLLETEEEKLKALISQPTNIMSNTTKQLHPLLQKNITPKLNLPKITKEALQLPLPKIPAELCKGRNQLSKTLSDLINDVHDVGISSWLESVTQIQTSLNQP